MILVLLLLGWLLLSGLRGAVNSAVARSKEAAEIEADRMALEKLKVDYEALLGMLRTRDRYLIQYDAVSRLSDDAYQAWSERTWKTVAVNQLAMIRAVRPLVYADYRSRVRAVSASYGTLPGPALSALREQIAYRNQPIAVLHESMLPLGESVSDTDFLFTDFTEPTEQENQTARASLLMEMFTEAHSETAPNDTIIMPATDLSDPNDPMNPMNW